MGDHPIPKWESDMGKLALAAKITHVPSMISLSCLGKTTVAARVRSTGIRDQQALPGNGRRYHYRFRYHWLVNSAYHINCADHFEGVYPVTSCRILFVT